MNEQKMVKKKKMVMEPLDMWSEHARFEDKRNETVVRIS